MMPHAVLSRRGAFGLAALLSLVRPPPNPVALPRALRARCWSSAASVRASAWTPAGSNRSGPSPSLELRLPAFPAKAIPPSWQPRGSLTRGWHAPWGWDTLENVW